ncbi:YopX family protein [Lacticaseibacillus paracasei]|uniref:YopX family protein n=1 Tax=Lacticaseibacillus paracasei TaxID=1597 RepID=UPI003C2B2AF1
MKREIKFRAWDKVYECYLYDVQNAYDTLSGCVKYEDGEDAGYDEECFAGFLDNDQYVVEQFTGLKDKNGREIYEGDIVRYTAWHDGKPAGAIQGEVVYDGDLGMASFNILLDRDGKIDRAVLPAIGVEIMGNVYENPELLEGKQ